MGWWGSGLGLANAQHRRRRPTSAKGRQHACGTHVDGRYTKAEERREQPLSVGHLVRDRARVESGLG